MSDHPPPGFRGRLLCVATMHGKQHAIAPPLERALGVRCVLPGSAFDSDRFGTFSGDVPREGSPREVARRKATAAMALSGADLAVASEGTFGPHPHAPFVTVGVELLLVVDRANDLEICSEHMTIETNHAGIPGRGLDEVLAFADRIGFPEHGVMLTLGDPPCRVAKGMSDRAAIVAAVAEIAAEARRIGKQWWARSDMRADRNPTRMRAIAAAAEQLAQRCRSRCPDCGAPGFGPVDVLRGLPCSSCGLPTDRVRAIVNGCARCRHRGETPRNDGMVAVDPGECQLCNP